MDAIIEVKETVFAQFLDVVLQFVLGEIEWKFIKIKENSVFYVFPSFSID